MSVSRHSRICDCQDTWCVEFNERLERRGLLDYLGGVNVLTSILLRGRLQVPFPEVIKADWSDARGRPRGNGCRQPLPIEKAQKWVGSLRAQPLPAHFRSLASRTRSMLFVVTKIVVIWSSCSRTFQNLSSNLCILQDF